MVNKAWRIIPRPLLETILNNHAHHHRVPQALFLHGPRGTGKTTLILERLLTGWNKGPHVTGYVDFARSINDHHPDHDASFPWSSWSTCESPTLSTCKIQLETCLESMAYRGIQLGAITSSQIFSIINKWHRLDTALRRIILLGKPGVRSGSRNAISSKVSGSALWDRAVFALNARSNASEIDKLLGFKGTEKKLSSEEVSYFREAIVALRLAKEVIGIQHGWRANAIADLNRTGRYSRSLANSCTDWPCLLLELLSQAAEVDHFQPKLVINNIEVLKNAILTDDSMVSASMYHDSLIWRIIALGANERCLPVLVVTSDSYYSYQAYKDFGFPDIFVSRETFGWSPQEAKMHMVTDYFSQSEWDVIVEVLGSNPRHLFELYALKQSSYYKNSRVLDEKSSSFEDIIDAYLAYLQATVVNPAIDKGLKMLQKFADDVCNGKVPKYRLQFGSPWRHPPKRGSPTLSSEWAKLQMMDFIHAFVNTEFGINYFADYSLEILDDPCTLALLEVGLLYAQRDPPFIRPVSRGIQRCLVRWLVQERICMSFPNSLRYWWHRFIRGRSYRHLMEETGYNK